MKKLSNLKLHNLSKAEMAKSEMGLIVGGADDCTCSCSCSCICVTNCSCPILSPSSTSTAPFPEYPTPSLYNWADAAGPNRESVADTDSSSKNSNKYNQAFAE